MGHQLRMHQLVWRHCHIESIKLTRRCSSTDVIASCVLVNVRGWRIIGSQRRSVGARPEHLQRHQVSTFKVLQSSVSISISISARFKLYKHTLITFNVLRHNNTSYLRDLLTIHNPSRNVRSSSHHLLSVGYMRTVSSSRCYKHCRY